MKIRIVQMIDVDDFDELVKTTYGRPYNFQQQDECKDRGTHDLTVPEDLCEGEAFENETVPEIVNHEEMGVSFKAWLARDPKQHLNHKDEDCRTDQWAIDMWWERNFYPHVQEVANDLHSKGLLPAGKYTIDIDW